MLILCLLWLVTTVIGQPLASPDGACGEGWECRQERHCDPYLDQKDRLEQLEKAYQQTGDEDVGAEQQKLLNKLKELVCNKEEKGVCCKKQLEIANGNIVERVEEIPFIVRLTVKESFSGSSRCGASLIAPQYLLSAKHCFEKFLEWCIEPTDCVAYFRDLKTGRSNHEKGQFVIPIVRVFEKAGVSDLAVVKLKHPVDEHPDYKLGIPLQPIRLAAENPKPGDEVLTGGWGLTGYNQRPSKELRSLTLKITKVMDIWVYTDTYNEQGEVADPCDGDSGGPLAIRRNGVWELVGVLEGGGYDCGKNRTGGDGKWNSVAAQRTWIENQLQPGGGKGEIDLRGWSGNIGDGPIKGNVYIGDKPVCDDGFGNEEARVACRMLGYATGIAERGSPFGNAELGEEFWRSDLKCQGDEESLENCPGKENASCTRGEVAGITCSDKIYLQTTTSTGTQGGEETDCGCTTDTLPHPRIVLLGPTGVGKSTFGNRLFGGDGKEAQCSQNGRRPYKFGVGHQAESHTNATSWMVGHYLGDPANPCITIIDTPGTGDTEGRDCDHAIALAEDLKKMGSIDAFLLLFKGPNLRFDQRVQEQISLFIDIFGENLFDNVITQFTFWSHDTRSIRKRNTTQEGLNEETKHQTWNQEYQDKFNVETEIPSVFIDPVYEEDYADPDEARINKENTAKLWSLITKEFRPFKCDKRCKAPSGFFSGQPWLFEQNEEVNKRLGDRTVITWQIWFAGCDGTGTKSFRIIHRSPEGDETTIYDKTIQEEEEEVINDSRLMKSMQVVDEPSAKFKTIRLTIELTEDPHFGMYLVENEKGESKKSHLRKIVDGEWEAWGAYGHCSKTCYRENHEPGGTMQRQRTCKPPQNGGQPCKGKSSESRACAHGPGDSQEVFNACPVAAEWRAWGEWTRCTRTCGVGTQRRLRSFDKGRNGAPRKPRGDESKERACGEGACPRPRRPATIVLSSTAGAAEWLGNHLGEFVEAGEHGGKPFYRQRDTEGTGEIFLYSEGGQWRVSDILGDSAHFLRNSQNTNTPPSTQWYGGWMGDGNKFLGDDTSLTLEFTTLSPICQLVRVAGRGDVVWEQGSSLGDYRLEEGRWSEGRPVFKKVDGETRFLFVREGYSSWAIRDSTTPQLPDWIQSGRATNSPTSPEAGPRPSKGVTRWRYADNNGPPWKEGDISVTCV